MKDGNKSKGILRKILFTICLIVFIVCVVLLMFGNQIKGHFVQKNTNRIMEEKVVKPKKNVNYDFKDVKEVTMKDVLSAHKITDKPIGKISVPAVGVKLPLFQGLNNEDMTIGACTMKANQVMGGMNNYAIAGHHMEDDKVLFSPLANAKVGDKIYLTDEKKVYVYQINVKKTVYKTDVSVINDVPGKRMVTLVTCASGTPGEVNRIIIQGDLVQEEDYGKSNQSLFMKD